MSGFGGGSRPPALDHEVADIMTETVIRYRRNALVVCATITCLYGIPNLDYGKLSLLGITFIDDPSIDNEKMVWFLLSILFAYQCASYLLYTTVAYRVWRRSVMLPDIDWWGYAFHLTPSKTCDHVKHLFNDQNAKSLHLVKGDDRITVVVTNNDNSKREITHYPTNRLFVYRMKLIMYWTIEFTLPFLLVCLALSLTIEKIGRLYW